MGVFVDTGYRTGLGTGFYDRSCELRLLGERVESVKTVVVYGPRGVGKSELVRYYTSRRLGGGRRILWVDARRRGFEEVIGLKPGLLSLLEELVGLLGAPRGVVRLVERLSRLIAPPPLLVVDEFHLLYSGLREALVELEAIAGLLAKGVDTPRLIVTVSEGFFATMDAVERLQGYSVSFMLVEPMEEAAFRELYSEYSRLHGCRLEYRVFEALAGGLPGYLPDLCGRSERLLEEWLELEAAKLRRGVEAAAARVGLGARDAYRASERLLQGEPPRDHREESLGEELVKANIAYPCQLGATRLYLPQLPFYPTLLSKIAAGGTGRVRIDDVVAGERLLPRCNPGCEDF